MLECPSYPPGTMKALAPPLLLPKCGREAVRELWAEPRQVCHRVQNFLRLFTDQKDNIGVRKTWHSARFGWLHPKSGIRAPGMTRGTIGRLSGDTPRRDRRSGSYSFDRTESMAVQVSEMSFAIVACRDDGTLLTEVPHGTRSRFPGDQTL